MIDHLSVLLDKYPGAANRTRCFTHILNLVAKCIMKQFDAPKKKKKTGGDTDEIEEDDDSDVLAAALDELEDELEDEDSGWEYDMRGDMTNEDVEKLEENVKPVRRVLSKVC
jgi:hypothetical protein